MSFDEILFKRIVDVVDTHVRPSLNMDGGDISILNLDGNVLSVRLTGRCSCCHRSQETLKHCVEKTLKQCVSSDIIVVAA